MAEIDKRVTLSILEYYDERIKDWVLYNIDDAVARNHIAGYVMQAELVSYFTEKEAVPTTFNGEDWTPELYPISEMTAEHGPWAVIVVKRKYGDSETLESTEYHVQQLDSAFSIYATDEDLEELRAEIEKDGELEII